MSRLYSTSPAEIGPGPLAAKQQHSPSKPIEATADLVPVLAHQRLSLFGVFEDVSKAGVDLALRQGLGRVGEFERTTG